MRADPRYARLVWCGWGLLTTMPPAALLTMLAVAFVVDGPIWAAVLCAVGAVLVLRYACPVAARLRPDGVDLLFPLRRVRLLPGRVRDIAVEPYLRQHLEAPFLLVRPVGVFPVLLWTEGWSDRSAVHRELRTLLRASDPSTIHAGDEDDVRGLLE